MYKIYRLFKSVLYRGYCNDCPLYKTDLRGQVSRPHNETEMHLLSASL